jgi:DNA-binding response OmpR family regulator
MAVRILIVEDDPDIAQLLMDSLTKEGYASRWVKTGREALHQARTYKPCLVLLDLILNGMSGIDVCRLLRKDEMTSAVSIIMVTARTEEADRIVGLEVGADDYVTKPFSVRELMARIRARLRSISDVRPRAMTIECGKLLVDPSGHRVVVDGRQVELSPTQFRLLHFFASHPGEVFSRHQIIEKVWGPQHVLSVRATDVFIRQLRRRIEPQPNKPVYLKTIPRIGYMFTVPDDCSAANF